MAFATGLTGVRHWKRATPAPRRKTRAGRQCPPRQKSRPAVAGRLRDNSVRLFDVASRAQVAELRGHTDYVHAVAWSPDGTRLDSGSGDFTVRVRDSLSPAERAARRPDTALTPDAELPPR